MAGRTHIAAVLLLCAFSASALDLGPGLPAGMADLVTGQGFIVLNTDSRIRYEAGAEAAASRTGELLPGAINKVESAHGLPFRRPVEVYVLASERSFVRLSPHARALTSRGRVYLSPRLFQSPAQVAGILAHELSHAHFMQYLATDRGPPDIPAWFREGFAVWLAGGAGAERVTPAQAVQAIRRGDGPPLDKRWQTDNLPRVSGRRPPSPHMFYRQSALFVEYLRHLDPRRFDLFVASLLDGIPFEQAFPESYGHSAEYMWKRFAAGLRANG